MTEFLQLIVIIACMAGTAFYAGIETGVISIHRMRLRHSVRKGAPGADILEGFLDNSDRLLGTTLVGTNLNMVIVSVVTASLGRRLMATWGEPVATAVATVLILTFCEYLPKAWFHSRPLDRCRRFAKMLRISEIIFKPVSTTIIGLSRLLVPGSSSSLADAVPFVTRDDLMVLAHESEEHGVLSPKERIMIHRVFELSGKLAGQIMIPLERMTTVPADATVSEFFEVAKTSGLTRMPVYDEKERAFVGILNVFFMLSYAGTSVDKPVAWFARPPLFVNESTPVDDILPLMRRFRQPMCLVQNGDQKVTGLITTEDILEEIVGATMNPSQGAPDREPSKAFGLIIIGTEILDGRVRDRHFETSRNLLAARHIALDYALVLKDDPAMLETQLRWAMGEQTPFFCCGGIGGTPDDYTRQCAARAADTVTELHEEAAGLLRNRFGSRATRQHLRMVEFPQGATLIPNPVNRIPGFSIGGGHFLPGFPTMAAPMMEWVLDTLYEKGEPKARHTFVLPGAREADITPMMESFTASHPGLSFSSLPRYTSTGTEVVLSVYGPVAESEKGALALRSLLVRDGIPHESTDKP